MISNIEELKAELIAGEIALEDEMYGCSEAEIQEIEVKYGKLPLSYRQILGLIGNSGGFIMNDSGFYLSHSAEVDGMISVNEWFLEFRKETIENNEVDDDLLAIPEHIFMISYRNTEFTFILTNEKESETDSAVYQYGGTDSGKVEKIYSSVWGWINWWIKAILYYGGRNNLYPHDLMHYRKPVRLESGETIIKMGARDLEIVRPFFERGRNEKSRYWLEHMEKLHQKFKATVND